MVVEKAPAKINLALDVLNKRSDGYHDLHMVMTTVDLFDRLQFDKLKEDKIEILCDKPYIPTDERNLVYKTAMLIKEKYNIKDGLKITIYKNIPVSAGLAGGSSDAAATIRALNKLFKLNMDFKEMINIGQKIGSDIPFCIYGKTAIAEGRGEIITPLPSVPKCWVVLIKPNFGVSTKEVFQQVQLDTILHPNVQSVIKSIKNNNYDQLCKNIGNSLEQVTFKLYPEVEELKQKMMKLEPDAVLMSGSGPTVFALTLSERKARRIINSINTLVYECYAVRILG